MDNPFKTWRKANDKSQEDLGAAVGVRAMTVSRWERDGHLPRKKLWSKIEEVTGITPSQLVDFVKQTEEAA